MEGTRLRRTRSRIIMEGTRIKIGGNRKRIVGTK